MAVLLQQFIETLREIRDTQITGSRSTPAVTNQAPDSTPQSQDVGDAMNNPYLEQAQRLSDFATCLTKVFANPGRSCTESHSAHIHLSGFDRHEIDMIISVCGESKPTCHAVQWASSTLPGSPDSLPNGTDSICSVLKSSNQALTRLRIHLQQDGTWKHLRARSTDRLLECHAPNKTLDSLLRLQKNPEEASTRLTRDDKNRLASEIAKSLFCLLGSPLLQGSWKSENILISDDHLQLSNEDFRIKPYIFGKLMHEASCGEPDVRSTKSAILGLGLLPWELMPQEKVAVNSNDMDEGEDKLLFKKLNKNEIELRKYSMFEEDYLDVIANCLNLYSGTSTIDAKFRERMYKGIVQPLMKRSPIQPRPPALKRHPDSSAGSQQSMVSIFDKKGDKPRAHRHVRDTMRTTASPLSTVTSVDDCSTMLAGGTRKRDASLISELGNGSPSRESSSLSIRKKTKYDPQLTGTPALPELQVLFDEVQMSQAPDADTQDFVGRMNRFLEDNILPPLEDLGKDIKDERQKRKIRIAVLDTGVLVELKDDVFKANHNRILEQRNFLGEDGMSCEDSYGHGTHVVRLLLRFCPFAEIIMAKISESKGISNLRPICEALRWVNSPECNADIIVMAFGLGNSSVPEIKRLIRQLVDNDKLIFVAASNGGGNAPRTFPATESGVFCVHVSDGKGNKAGINPPPQSGNNFSTLGKAIDSRWQGKEVHITGSSFATPVAASIAANALEFVRRTLEDKKANYFYRYQGMRTLFFCLADNVDGYDYVKPWKRHLWDDGTEPESSCASLRHMERYGEDSWKQRTSDYSFTGFE